MLLSASFLMLTCRCPGALGDTDPASLRAARHAANRLAFGADEREIERIARDGLAATLERWIDESRPFRPGPRVAETLNAGFVDPSEHLAAIVEQREEGLETQSDYVRPLAREAAWWLEEMAHGPAPLRENLALFWHGHFATTFRGVGVAEWMVGEAEIEREQALGSFGELLRAIARSPAMLRLLDNEASRRSHPNENWARELLELFTLGPGPYEELDVREIARAFTGWKLERGVCRFDPGEHDYGRKTALGLTGILDGEHVFALVLAQPECGRFLAAKLLAWIEGEPPDPNRAGEYADVLRASDYDVSAFLRHLVRDPRFLRDEIVGQRIAGPVAHFAQMARRLDLDVPGLALWEGAAACSQKLFYPPGVKGWEEGPAWITTNTIVQRDNVTAFLLGGLPETFWERDSDAAAWRWSWGVLRRVHNSGWDPHPRSSGLDRAGGDGSASADALRAHLDELTLPRAQLD